MRITTFGLAVLFALPLLAQHGSSTTVNPYTGPDHQLAGAKLFASQCAGCHGPNAAGTGAGPSLASGAFRHGGSDEALFHTISKGVPGTTMPAFTLSGLEVWELVTHIRTAGIARGATETKGDLASGAALFRANCSPCHSTAGQGGFTGPDLTGVGARRSYAEIRESLIHPDTAVDSAYWSISATTSTGAAVRGIRLNEDTFSIQIRNEQGRLMSLSKQNLKAVEIGRRSPMPSFAGKLSDTQMNDVIAWLISLGREQQ